MYSIVSLIGLIIRQYYLPNPFEKFGYMGAVYNILASIIIWKISYYSVGIIYEKGSAPFIGSLLYTAFFALYSFELWLTLKPYPNELLIVLILGLFILFDFILIKILNKCFDS